MGRNFASISTDIAINDHETCISFYALNQSKEYERGNSLKYEKSTCNKFSILGIKINVLRTFVVTGW
jgi:hypothetical protein